LCSDTKAKPLMWRRFAEEFIGKNQYTTAQAFQVKLVYYKNLVAYEITNHWNQEPPPKEILEDVTAKGGNVMGRTLENFAKPPTREEKLAEAAEASDTSPGQITPKEEKTELVEDPGSAAGRSSRGLRQQPPQRVLFQPDTASRQTRGQSSAVNASPTPGAMTNGIMNAPAMTNGATSTLASYEPTVSYPLTLKPLPTPSNNAEHYRNERKRKAEANAGPLARKYRQIMLPGTGFIGPNIYVRAQMALQSGIPEEEEFALHHLVKISHERGDKYKFVQFPGLADALVRKVLQVSSLFYDINWDVNYDDETFQTDEETLNGLTGTPNIIAKLKSRSCHITDDSVEDAQFLSELNRILEAALAIRNMCMLEDNAKYIATMPLIQDMITVILNLPDRPCTVELRHYALEIAEQVLRHCDVNTQDDLYQSLVCHLRSSDRGTLVTTLKTVARLGMSLPAPKRLEDVPPATLRNIQSWLLVEDEELRGACLDFLIQYTSIADNVDNLLQHIDSDNLAKQLTRLLLFDAKEQKQGTKPESKDVDATMPPVPRLSRSVVEPLLKLDEPERSSEWLRMCFMPDVKSEMTQINLWQAYQGTFAPFSATHPHLIAGEFIKNVSTVFTGATAQVAHGNKYVIRGIRARKVPVQTGMSPGGKATDKGKEMIRCCWKVTIPVEAQRDPVTGAVTTATTRETACGEWFRSSVDMLKHICANHLRLPPKKTSPTPAPDGDDMDIDVKPTMNGLANGTNGDATVTTGFDFAAGDQQTHRCHWADCKRSSDDFRIDGQGPATALLVRHIQTHIPVDSTHDHEKPSEQSNQPLSGRRQVFSTLQDETGDAAGLPLGAALVLRNIARFMPKSLSNSKDSVRAAMTGETGKPADGPEDPGMIGLFFNEDVRRGLFDALSHNKTLIHYVGIILRNVRRSGG
jgi:chromatin structure-remodeling complex subunit RSC9